LGARHGEEEDANVEAVTLATTTKGRRLARDESKITKPAPDRGRGGNFTRLAKSRYYLFPYCIETYSSR
jgi:hypothetical protein